MLTVISENQAKFTVYAGIMTLCFTIFLLFTVYGKTFRSFLTKELLLYVQWGGCSNFNN